MRRRGVAAVDGEVSGEIIYRAAELGESRCKVFLSFFLVTGRRIQLADLTCKGGAVSSGNTGRVKEVIGSLSFCQPYQFLLRVNCIEQCTTEITLERYWSLLLK